MCSIYKQIDFSNLVLIVVFKVQISIMQQNSPLECFSSVIRIFVLEFKSFLHH